MGNPQEDPLAVHCFCVCSSSALLRDLGVSRSMERDLSLSCRHILGFSLCIVTIVTHYVSSLRRVSFYAVVFCCMFMCVSCFGLVVSTCQVISEKDFSEDAIVW